MIPLVAQLLLLFVCFSASACAALVTSLTTHALPLHYVPVAAFLPPLAALALASAALVILFGLFCLCPCFFLLLRTLLRPRFGRSRLKRPPKRPPTTHAPCLRRSRLVPLWRPFRNLRVCSTFAGKRLARPLRRVDVPLLPGFCYTRFFEDPFAAAAHYGAYPHADAFWVRDALGVEKCAISPVFMRELVDTLAHRPSPWPPRVAAAVCAAWALYAPIHFLWPLAAFITFCFCGGSDYLRIGGPMEPSFFADTPLMGTVLALHTGDYQKLLSTARTTTPHAVPRHMERFLLRAGVELPPPGALSHAHGVHYAFERLSLHVAARIIAGSDWAALWLNPAKVQHMQHTPGLTAPTHTFNPRYVAKDITRYRGSAAPVSSTPSLPPTVWFAHDVIHHLSPSAVGQWFDANPNLETLVATAVIPPELLFGLSALTPDLYNFERRGSDLIYIPEGDNSGAYVQPADCAKWLTANRLITPASRCLHVGVVHSNHAHHVIVISRTQMLPERERVFDLPALTSIPILAHPFGGLYARLTDPGLVTALVNYSTRVSATSIRDLYAKVASYRAEVYGHYNPSYVRAAVLYACFVRARDFHSPLFGLTRFWVALGYAMHIPFLPVAWLYQSYTSREFSTRIDVPIIWTRKLSELVSHPSDLALPGVTGPKCNSHGVGIFYLPPQADLLARVSRTCSVFGVYIFGKVVFFLLAKNFSRIEPWITYFVGRGIYIFDLSWHWTPLAIILILLSYWVGLEGPELPWVNPLPFAWRVVTRSYAHVWFLSSAGVRYRPGLSWGYTVSLLLNAAYHTWPRLSPVQYYFSVNSPTWQPKLISHIVHTVVLGWLLAVFLVYGLCFPSRITLPHHDPELALPTAGVPPGSPLPPPSSPPASVASTLGIPSYDTAHSSWHTGGLGAVRHWLRGLAPEYYDPPTQPTDVDPREYVAIRDAYYRGLRRHCLRRWVRRRRSSAPAATPSVSASVSSAGSVSSNDSSLYRLPHLGISPRPGSPASSSTASDASMRSLPAPEPPAVEPPAPLPPVPPPHHAPLDPYWRFAILPSAYDDVNQFAQVARRLTPIPGPDPARSCVWDVVGRLVGVDPMIVHDIYHAHLPLDRRRHFEGGPVPYPALQDVLRFFRLGGPVYPATQDRDAPRGPGLRPALPSYDSRHAPVFELAGAPGWPTARFYTVESDNAFHFTTEAIDEAGVLPAPPTLFDVVGFTSRFVPRAELLEVVSVPTAWLRSFGRLVGAAMNTSFITCPSLARVQSQRSVFAPLPAIPIVRETQQYVLNRADAQLARDLAADMKNHPSSLNLHEWNARTIASGLSDLAKHAAATIADPRLPQRPPVQLHLFHGAAGTGKTTAMLGFIEQLHAQRGLSAASLRFHTWLISLRGPLQRAVEARVAAGTLPRLTSANLATACMPFAQPFGGVLVLDDATQLWPGFIPLLVATNPAITDIVCTFDACQARSVFPMADALTRTARSTADWLSSRSEHYATLAYRTSADISALFGLPTPPPAPGFVQSFGRIYTTSASPADVPSLVVSPRFAETQNNGGVMCITFRDCQGMEIAGDVSIDLGGLTATATDHAAWTALTRATGSMYLTMGPLSTVTGRDATAYGKSQILSAILAAAATANTAEVTTAVDPQGLVRDAVYSHFARCLSPAACARLGLPAPNPIVAGWGVDEYNRAGYLEQDRDFFFGDFWTPRSHRAESLGVSVRRPAFSRHAEQLHSAPVNVAHTLRHIAAIPNDAELDPVRTDYHLPPKPNFTVAPDPGLNFTKFQAEERREIVLPNFNSTTQHIVDGPQASLWHKRQDQVTVRLSEQKRIRVGYDHAGLSRDERSRLRQLQSGFKKFFDVAAWNHQRFDPVAFDSATRRALGPWISKRTKRQIQASVAKCDLDSPLNYTRLFLKGQVVQKEPKRFSPATAGQIVSEFSLVKQFRDAPYALYLEDMLFRYKRPTTYMHARASPATMSEWYRTHWRPGIMTANDYTAWDGGCDRVFCAFDCWLMSLSGLPVDYINIYRREKMETYSHLGPHMARQESGDRWTWLLNTARNAALTGASLNCPVGTPSAFSGDDMVTLGSWNGMRNFAPSHWRMTPKLERDKRIVFCGFRFGDDDVTVAPEVVLHRAQNGMAMGRNDSDFWRSISDAVREAAPGASDASVMLSTASTFVDRAAQRFGFEL